jgi:hypothetical protein
MRVQKKPVKKSSMPWNCHIATRLVFTWCGCNLVKKCRWLQHPLHVVATSDVQQLQKKWQLQNQNVGDCLRPYSSVIASIDACVVRNCRLRVFGKKRKKITEPVCDCNYLASVIATRSYVCCNMETWLRLCACKATWLFGIWLQAWVVSDCKKLKCLIAKSAGLFLW